MDIKQTFLDNRVKFNRIVNKSIKNYKGDEYTHLNNINTLFIPAINFKKEVAKSPKIKKEDFLKYLNIDKLDFGEAFLMKDSLIMGAIVPCPSNDCNYMLLAGKNEYLSLIEPLSKALYDIKPDLVFNIYNIPYAYWHIKNNELNVFVIDSNKSRMEISKVLTAKDYIQQYIDEEDIIYLKQVKVVGR